MAGAPQFGLNNEEGISTRDGALMPRPTKSGVIGPPKIKMQNKGGQHPTRMSAHMPKSSLGRNLKPLPQNPFQSMHGTQPSLLQSRSPIGLEGIK